MSESESPEPCLNRGLGDSGDIGSLDELDLSSIQGLRHFQRSLIVKEPSVETLTKFLPDILSSALRADQNLEWQLAALDALSIWLLRATRCSDPGYIGGYITSSQWDTLLSLPWVRWASAPNAIVIQKVLKDAFSKLLILQRKLYPDWETRQVDLFEKVVGLREVDLKIQCYLIDVLCRRVSNGAERLLEWRPTWVVEMLSLMKDSGLGPAVGKCLVTVLMVRRTELLKDDPENGHVRWLETWKDPLLRTVRGSDENHIRLVNKYFLPTLSKECPTAFADLLQSMADEIQGKEQVGGLQAFMLCLSIARRKGLLPDDPTLAFADMDLPSTFFHSLLTFTSPSIRLSAFDLLTFHTHQKTPLSTNCYSMIQSVLPILFADQDGEFRNELLKSLRNLILRVRSSTHSAAKESERRISKLGNHVAELNDVLETATRFMKWFIEFCSESITPGRSYYTASMALKTLHIMADEGLFSDLDVDLRSGVLSGIKADLFSKSFLRVLMDRLIDPYEEVGALACGLIERIKDREMVPWDVLYSSGKVLCLSGRADKSDGGARVLNLCQRYGIGFSNIWQEVWNSVSEDIGRKTFVPDRPLHGRLVALRTIPGYGDDVVERVLILCRDVWDLVSPVLTDDSPEGNFLDLNSTLRDSASQDLLSSSWRSLKEAAALLGSVLSTPRSTLGDYETAGLLFMEWLSRIRHRGAFSAVMPVFESLCRECFKDSKKNLQSLPRKWLEDCLSSITETTRSITRRSGGLPMLITAILVAESEIHTFELTKLSLERLSLLSEMPVELSAMRASEPAKWDLPQVHSQNALRAIFSESRLSQTSFGFVESGFAIAIKGFSSDIFSIRNCSIMLYDSLLTRALGQKYARQDIDPSAPNRSVSSKVFFSKFPKLSQYLLDELTLDVSHVTENPDNVNTGLYPVLTLLSRLDVSKLSGGKKYTGMQPFRPLIQQCMGAKIWKLRAMAARCLPTVLEPEFLSQEIASLFAGFRLDAQNQLHGGLMGLKCLSEFYSYRMLKDVVYSTAPLRVQSNLDAILLGLEDKLEYLLCQNPNPLTRAVVVEIVQCSLLNETKGSEIVGRVYHICMEDIRQGCRAPVGSQMYLAQAASFVLATMTSGHKVQGTVEEILDLLLRSSTEEVIVCSLEWLNKTHSELTSLGAAKQAVRDLVTQSPTDGIGALALRVLSQSGQDEDTMDLVECISGLQKDNVLPVKEGWIIISGASVRQEYAQGNCNEAALSTFFKIIHDSLHSAKSDSTRLAAVRSLQRLSPILTLALEKSTDYSSLVPAYFSLLLALSDDDEKIRYTAAQVTTFVLGEYMIPTPMAASEKLAQAIGENLDPRAVESYIISLICETKVVETLKGAIESSDILFAKERDNVWRDELYEWGLYIKILSACWSRQMGLESDRRSQALEEWLLNGIAEMKELSQMEDPPFGWSQDIDAFESVIKVFKIAEVILRYGRGEFLQSHLEDLEARMASGNGNGYLAQKLREISRTG